MNNRIFIFLLTIVFCGLITISSLIGCANQQPPGGGDEDKIAPKVKIVSPKPNSVNFRGNSITFEFNEYVDRRSFQDAFRVSPAIKGDLEFDWGGKDVEVSFPSDLYKTEPNKTFVINVNTNLKDIRGNAITEPVNFAFSTGTKIDMGGVDGKVYADSGKVISIFAYKLNGINDYDPLKNIPDYFTETDPGGNYVLTNLSPGKYRIISVIDDDRNLLYAPDMENYGVLPYDVDVKDSVISKSINFYLKNIQKHELQPELDVTKYFKDTLNTVYTSVEPGSLTVLPEQSIFIFFNRYAPAREDFVSSFKITDENGTTEKVVYNWKNDSLVEVFSANKFAANRKYNITFSIKTLNDSLYNFNLPFRTVSTNSFGDVKGVIKSNYSDFNIFDYPIRIDLEAKALIPLLKYRFETRDSIFSYKGILEADYTLFSYVDKNDNSVFDYGNPYPFEYSEPFYFYPQPLGIKGGWTVENVIINFIK